jgi:hypothetical protein
MKPPKASNLYGQPWLSSLLVLVRHRQVQVAKHYFALILPCIGIFMVLMVVSLKLV